MLRLLRQVSYRQLRASWGRTALVVGGIATGVALIVAINVINTSVLANFRRTIELIAGPAALEVTLGVGELGFDESTVEIVRADPDVAAAVPFVRGTISFANDPGETLQLFGADLTAEKNLDRYNIRLDTDSADMLVWLADRHSIALTRTLAERLRLPVDGAVKLSTPEGVGDFTVRGLLEPEGLARALGGSLALMDLPAAQMILGKTGRVDQIDLMLQDGADREAVQSRLEKALPETLTVSLPAQRSALYENVLGSFQAMLTGWSLLCLVAGVYIIYNTTSTGAVHRALAMAGLRLAGAEASQLFGLLILEALVLGVIGTLAGIPTGVALAWLLTGMVSDSMGVVFQLRFPVEALALESRELVLIAATGIGAALFASYFAARRVSRLDPLEVMRARLGSISASVPARRLVAWWAGLVLVTAVALYVEIRFQSIAWGNFASTLWFAASIVIAIPIVSLSGRFVSGLLMRVFGARGRVAAESLYRSATRTGVTVAAIALVLTVAITFASLSLSHRNSVRAYFVEGFLASDLAVSAVATEGGWLESPISGDVATELGKVRGIRSVETLRILPGNVYRGQRIAVVGLSDGLLDPERYPRGWYRAGDPAHAAAVIRAETAANVSTSFADRFGKRVGDTITLDTPTGPLALEIAGIVPDYVSDRGTVLLSRRLVIDRWLEPGVNRIHLFLDDGTSVEVARERVREQLSGRYRLKILSLQEGVDYLSENIDRAYAFTVAIQLLIVLVTAAGIFDLLLAAIWERRRELALWRVIGADEREVRQSVVIESMTIGALGAILGVPVGLVTAGIWIGINYRYLLGYYVEYYFAVGSTAWFMVLVMVMTLLAGYAAARHATRQSVLEGIQTE